MAESAAVQTGPVISCSEGRPEPVCGSSVRFKRCCVADRPTRGPAAAIASATRLSLTPSAIDLLSSRRGVDMNIAIIGGGNVAAALKAGLERVAGLSVHMVGRGLTAVPARTGPECNFPTPTKFLENRLDNCPICRLYSCLPEMRSGIPDKAWAFFRLGRGLADRNFYFR